VSVKPVNLIGIISDTEGIYEAIVIASKRARQIHQDSKIELNQRLETIAQLTTTVDIEEEMDVTANPDQLKMSLEFEQRPKPTELAVQELTGKRLQWRYKELEKKESEETDTE